MILEEMSLEELVALRLDVNKYIRIKQGEQTIPEHPYHTINCPVCKRDIKDYILELCEIICTKYGCGLCENFIEPYSEATKCHSCNSIHINFKARFAERSNDY